MHGQHSKPFSRTCILATWSLSQTMAIAIQTPRSFLPAVLVMCVNRQAIDTAAASGAIKGEVTLSTQLLMKT